MECFAKECCTAKFLVPDLVKGELPLEVDEQPAIAEEVVEAGFVLHECMHWGIQQLHQIPQGQQLGMHCPTRQCAGQNG